MVDSDEDLGTEEVDICTGAAEPAPRRPDTPSPLPAGTETAAPSLADRLLEGSPAGVLACDERGVVRSANPAARALLPDLRLGQLLVGPLADRAAGPAAVELTDGPRRLTAHRLPLPAGWTAWFVSDVTEQHARVDALLAERARARFLAGAGRRLGGSLHPGRTARAVAELAVTTLADAAVVVWPSAGGRDVVEWVSRERGGAESDGRAATRTLPGPVVDALHGTDADPRPVLLDDLADAPWPGPAGIRAGTRSARTAVGGAGVVTLPGDGAPVGVLVLLRHEAVTNAPAATAGDAALVEEFAQRAGIALAAAALHAQRTHTANVLRTSLAQPPLRPVAGMTLGAVYRPADEGLLIGGDFYDVLPRPDGATTFLLGDVCGKGVEAAVSTGQVRQSVLALRRLVDDPVDLLGLLNATMLETMPADVAPRFVTLVLGAATPRPDGGVAVHLAGGGHLPPLVVRRGGGVEQVDIGGMLLGAVPEARFASRRIDLAPGEACVLYTDGVTDAPGGVDGRQAFGEERLMAMLTGCDVLPAPGIAERVALHATRWVAGGSRDDIAVLVVQAPLPVRRPAGRHLHSVPPEALPPGLPPPPSAAWNPTAWAPTGWAPTARPPAPRAGDTPRSGPTHCCEELP